MDDDTMIPEEVIEGLMIVRETGATNMFDRRNVLTILGMMDADEAVAWLETHKNRYMDALNAMGARVRKEHEER